MKESRRETQGTRELTMNPFLHLANAIIEQATKDYTDAVTRKRADEIELSQLRAAIAKDGSTMTPDAVEKANRRIHTLEHKKLEQDRTIHQVEMFFTDKSPAGWFSSLTDLNGEHLLRRLRQLTKQSVAEMT